MGSRILVEARSESVQGGLQKEVRGLLCGALGMVTGSGLTGERACEGVEFGKTKVFLRSREAEFLLEVKLMVERRATLVLQPFLVSSLARERLAHMRRAGKAVRARPRDDRGGW